jgi:hypothetical protein
MLVALGLSFSPIVIPHYRRIELLTIPPMPALLGVLFARAACCCWWRRSRFWRKSRATLVVGLGLARCTAVGWPG